MSYKATANETGIISEMKKPFLQMLKDDREDGVRHAFYTVIKQLALVTAYDHIDEFVVNGNLLYSQGFTEHRTIEGETVPGVERVRLHIFSLPKELQLLETATNDMGYSINGDGVKVFDSVSWAFGYIPGSWDIVVAEVLHAPKHAKRTNVTPKKKKRK